MPTRSLLQDVRPQVLLDDESYAAVHRAALGRRADAYLSELLAAKEMWTQEEIRLFGRRVPLPRLTAWYGDPGHVYTYSGIRMEPRPWTPLLREIRDRTAAIAGAKFNTGLLNRYRNGRDSVAWHADDEPELGENPVIGSVSLGADRAFHLRRKVQRDMVIKTVLRHGDVLVMSGATQRFWVHQVPKTGKPVEERVNITFRRIVSVVPNPPG